MGGNRREDAQRGKATISFECKCRSLIQSHKQVWDNNSKSGRKRKSFEYYNEMEEVVAKRHNINPPVVGGSNLELSNRPLTQCRKVQYRRIDVAVLYIEHQVVVSALRKLSLNSEEDENALKAWYKCLADTLNTHAPIKSKRIKRNKQPVSYSSEIAKAQKSRDFYHKRKDLDNYRYLRNKTKSLIFKGKHSYFHEAVTSNKDNRDIWRHLNAQTSSKGQLNYPRELILSL